VSHAAVVADACIGVSHCNHVEHAAVVASTAQVSSVSIILHLPLVAAAVMADSVQLAACIAQHTS